jgi:hypothetical protein
MNGLDCPPPTERALEYLRESDAIEEIHEIDYARPENRAAGTGHWGAFCDMVHRAQSGTPLYGATLALWQGLVCTEQVRAGHPLEQRYIGRMRGPDTPIDVTVGGYRPPSYAEVPALMSEWLEAANQSADTEAFEDSARVAAIADTLQTFEAIHPFADGNGRVGRLVANWIALRHGAALIVFRATERPSYYAAHRSKRAMRLFIGGKVREAISDAGIDVTAVDRGDNFDVYRMPDGGQLTIERHELLAAMDRWAAEQRERER